MQGLGALINWLFFNWERNRMNGGASERKKTELGFNWGVPVIVFSSFFFIFLFSRAGLWLAALTALQHGGDGHVT